MAGNHGVQSRKLLPEGLQVALRKKYKKLSEAKGFIDFGHVFKDDVSLSYIDGVHYSPASNKKIALELSKYLN